MATFREWFDEFTVATGERPTHIVLGWEHGWGDYSKGPWPEWDRWGHVVEYDDVPVGLLDHEFDEGFGGNESPNLAAWSATFVLFSDNYDGAEHLNWVPRNPIDHEPARPGGG
jgi:hypothetical protein